MKDYPVRLTMGQTAFLVISLCLIGFLDFYLGARFGPELFWDVRIDRKSQSQLLPPEDEDAELQALLKEEGTQDISFHEELSRKNSKFEQEPVKLVEEASSSKAAPEEVIPKKENTKSDIKKIESQKTDVVKKTDSKKTEAVKAADTKIPKAAAVKPSAPKPKSSKPVVPKPPKPSPVSVPEGKSQDDPIGKQIEGEIVW